MTRKYIRKKPHVNLQRPNYLPTQEQIEEAAAEIRRGWSDAIRRNRETVKGKVYSVPIVRYSGQLLNDDE